jgi:hypothetical protein
VREPGLRGRKLHRHVCPRSQAVLEQRSSDLHGERPVGHGDGMCLVGVRERRVLGRLCARRDAVLG